MEQTTTHTPLYYLLRPPPPRRRWRDGRATGSAQRATGVRIARHRRTDSDMQLACQAAPTRSLTAGVRTGGGRGSIGTSPPESRADARGNSRAWRQSLFRPSERRRSRGGDWYAPPRGRDVGDRGPTRGQRAGREAALCGPLSRAAHMFGRVAHMSQNHREMKADRLACSPSAGQCVSNASGNNAPPARDGDHEHERDHEDHA
jgi:hypothetical protein